MASLSGASLTKMPAMSEQTPATTPQHVVAGSVPPISRLSYFDVLLGVLRESATKLDELRIAIGRHVDELAARGKAKRTRDWRHPLAYRDTVVACVRELVRWELASPLSLGDDPDAYERAQETAVQLTDEGCRLASMRAAERREAIGQRLLVTYPLFQRFLETIQSQDVRLPEFSDSSTRAFFPALERVTEDDRGFYLAARACADFGAEPVALPVRRGPLPSSEEVLAGLRASLRRRFSKRPPRSMGELRGALNKAVGSIFLRKLGFTGEWNSFDRCLRWGRDLYLANDGRHVCGIPGWLTWSAADARRESGSWQFERRGVSRYRQEVKHALLEAYRLNAEKRRGGGIHVPLIPIFEVRETAAFLCRVCDEVVDLVLGDLALRRDSAGNTIVELHLGDVRHLAPSARPFFHEGKRYFYVTMHDSRSLRASGGSNHAG
jgi:hypothetical protein